MPSHDMEHCTGEGCGVRSTCHRYRQWEDLPDSLQGCVAVRMPLGPVLGGCELYWRVPPRECPQPGHGRKYMHGDTLLCLECGGLIPAGAGSQEGDHGARAGSQPGEGGDHG